MLTRQSHHNQFSTQKRYLDFKVKTQNILEEYKEKTMEPKMVFMLLVGSGISKKMAWTQIENTRKESLEYWKEENMEPWPFLMPEQLSRINN